MNFKARKKIIHKIKIQYLLNNIKIEKKKCSSVKLHTYSRASYRYTERSTLALFIIRRVRGDRRNHYR